jgi:Protein of unknown function (DUF1634)
VTRDSDRAATPALAQWVAAALRYGTIGAVALVAVGFAWATIAAQPRGGTRPVVEEISRASGDAVIGMGLMALTLLPIAVLVVAGAAFRRAGEHRMLGVTAAVALLIVASLAAAAAFGPAI